MSHAVRVLLNDAGPFATVRWAQSGFHRPANTAPAGITGRNLFGQVDGTVNPTPGTEDFADVVWLARRLRDADLARGRLRRWWCGGSRWTCGSGAGWTSMTKEDSIGRRLSDGAPLTGGTEFTAPDYEAVDDNGFLVIPPTAHMRLAHAQAPVERILRRPYNYDDGIAADGTADAGLIFVAYQADPVAQFVPIQERLATSDVLNIWTTPIGSALFAVPAASNPASTSARPCSAEAPARPVRPPARPLRSRRSVRFSAHPCSEIRTNHGSVRAIADHVGAGRRDLSVRSRGCPCRRCR